MANTVLLESVPLRGFVAISTNTRNDRPRCSAVAPVRLCGIRRQDGASRLCNLWAGNSLHQYTQKWLDRETSGFCRAAVPARAQLKTYEEAPPKDGQSRLYTNPMCPYAQRSWIGAKYKGLDEQLESVEVDLRKMPQWYKDLYPVGKVPSIEHNGQVTGESLDVLRYLDANFDGPKLEPASEVDRKTVERLLEFCDKELIPTGFGTTTMKDAAPHEYKAGMKPVLDVLERQLEATDAAGKGPYLVGDFSTADAAIVPFLWRFQFILENFQKQDLFEDHPRLAKYFEMMHGQAFFADTKGGQERMYSMYKLFLDNDYFNQIGLAKKPAAVTSS